MNAEQLKDAILQEAISGRLVSQLEEEPVVEQIGETPEKIPFTIPKKWKWIELKNLVVKRKNITPDKLNKNIQLWSIPAYDNGSPEIRLNSEVGSSKKIVHEGDVLLSKIVPHIRRSWLITHSELMQVASTEWLVFNHHAYDGNFLVHLFKSYYFNNELQKTTSGMGSLKRASPKKLEHIFLPLPPLSEQRRIVEKINELLPLVEEYGKAQQRLNKLNTELPDKLKASLLQEAISGKLVPQLEEEPAVEQIGGEPEEIPFTIPDKWKWVSLSNIAIQIYDGDHNPPPNAGSGIPILSAKNVHSNKINLNEAVRWVTPEQWASLNKKLNIEPGDLLVTIVGTLGRSAVVKTNEKFSLQRSVSVIKPDPSHVNSDYLNYVIQSPLIQNSFTRNSSGTAQQGVYLGMLKKFAIPLPSLNEQHRIVAKLETVISEVDKLIIQQNC